MTTNTAAVPTTTAGPRSRDNRGAEAGRTHDSSALHCRIAPYLNRVGDGVARLLPHPRTTYSLSSAISGLHDPADVQTAHALEKMHQLRDSPERPPMMPAHGLMMTKNPGLPEVADMRAARRRPQLSSASTLNCLPKSTAPNLTLSQRQQLTRSEDGTPTGAGRRRLVTPRIM